jgi:uncharacterized repeat protein (TIGR01451 family)
MLVAIGQRRKDTTHTLASEPLSGSPSLPLRFLTVLLVIAAGFFGIEARSTGAATGTISGIVFQDYNYNGARDTAAVIVNNGQGTIEVAFDRGVQGITVTAYTPAGAVAGSAVTDASGNYSINTGGSTGPYRVEFTGLPAGYRDGPVGANSRTTVQFVADGNSPNTDLGIVIPDDFSQNNPIWAVPCYVTGPQNTPTPVIVAYPYSAGSSRDSGDNPVTDYDQPMKAMFANANQVGTVWGLGWARNTRFLYASAFMKKYSGFGPSGTGAIYRINPDTATVGTYVDLNAIFGAGTAGADQHNFSNTRDNDNVTWNLVGKVSLGGIAVSDDQTKLYAINLANRTLYQIPLNAAPSAANIVTSAIPLNPPGCTATDDVRPFALQFYRGRLYLGTTCTGESSTTGGTVQGNSALLRAYVYSLDPATLTFGAPVLDIPLNYPRRCADSAQLGPPACFSAAWLPWTPVYRNIAEAEAVGSFRRTIYPQPWLTSIDFDNGDMLLGIRDRLGDQAGVASPDKPGSSQLFYAASAGDVLRACGNPASGWTLESNGRCGGAGIGPQNNGQGPGNAEFYFRDNSPIFNDEIAMGGMLQVPGFPDFLSAVIHPIPIVPTTGFDSTLFDGGVRWFRNSTGGFSKNLRIYDDELEVGSGFGKANGLGDIVALFDVPPTEIGNYVWCDDDRDGIQDPNEPVLPGVTVQLYLGAALVASTVTNASGNYLFNNSNVPGGIMPGVGYEVRISLGDGALGGKELTTPNQGTDLHDSDGVPVGGFAVIPVSVAAPGANNHTFDFGFRVQVTDTDLQITKRAVPNCVKPGDEIRFQVTVKNNGPADATGVTVIDNRPLALTLVNVTTSKGVCNGSNPINCAIGNLASGESATINIFMSVPPNTLQGSFTNTATVTGNEPDPNPSNNSATATAFVLIPGDPNASVGPGEAFLPGMINDQKAGSILIYNLYTSSLSQPNEQNTRLVITNTHPGMFVIVHLFFIDGLTCSVADQFVCLTQQQTMSFLTSELDPGTTGYVIAVAVDGMTGCPIEFNHLIGEANIKFASGHRANLPAEAVARVPGGTAPTCDGNSPLAALVFNGLPGNYEPLPLVLASSSVLDGNTGNQQLLVVNGLGGNLFGSAIGAPEIFGLMFNSAEILASFSERPTTCQLRGIIDNNFPRVAPPFTTHIAANTVGWMKFWSAQANRAISGAIINFNPNAGNSPSAFNQGRNLHKLTYLPSTTMVMPVLVP